MLENSHRPPRPGINMDGVFEAANPTKCLIFMHATRGNSAHAPFSWAPPYVTSPLQAGMDSTDSSWDPQLMEKAFPPGGS